MATDDPILSILVAKDIYAADSELWAFGYVVKQIHNAGLIRQINGSKTYLSVNVSLPAIGSHNELSIGAGNLRMNGNVAGADLELLEQGIAEDILIALEEDLANLEECPFADAEGNLDPFLVRGIIQGTLNDASLEISLFAEVGG